MKQKVQPRYSSFTQKKDFLFTCGLLVIGIFLFGWLLFINYKVRDADILPSELTDGVFDMRSIDFSKYYIHADFGGNLQYYPGEYDSPEQLDGIASVDYDDNASGAASAMFRYNLLFSGDSPVYAEFTVPGHSGRLFVNGSLIDNTLPFGRDTEGVGYNDVYNFTAVPEGGRLDVVIAAQAYDDGTFNWNYMKIASPERQIKFVRARTLLDAFVLGGLLLSFALFVILFLFVGYRPENLYFALICLITALYGSTISTRLFYFIFQDIPFTVKVENISLTLIIVFLVLYIDKMFQGMLQKPVLIGIAGFFTFISALMAVMPYTGYKPFVLYFYIIAFCSFAYIFIRYIIAVRELNLERMISLAGFLVIFLACVNDILSSFGLSWHLFGFYGNLVPQSMIIFVLMQMVSLFLLNARQTEEAHEAEQRMAVEADIQRQMNITKSNFLASMSHEIRTPMNAITGMAELLLRGELSDEARGYAQDIKQAGNNLLSIINDILDFSKIESGKLEIVPVKYLLSSLVNDTVNIIRTRLIEKPIRFFTNIDGNIPNNLIGDEVRLRQILLNLLSNAVKYSDKGHIGLTITVDKRDDKQVWLRIAVTDTGKGIKPEDQARLFDEFVRVDMKKNQSIEGTGLGLAITRRLCLAMGGDITMKSEYGSGSEFTVIIPQYIESEAPFASVEEPGQKKVLVYEGRLVYAKSICWTLENLKVPHTMVTNQDDFEIALCREEWFYVFSGYGLYDRIKLVMERTILSKEPPLALLIEWGTEAYIPGARFVSLPVQSLSVANVLNGKADSKDYAKSSGIIRFTFPRARLLVVDDIATNLQVAKGLLAPYMVTVDTCLSGSQAVEMVKHAASQKRNYDIVFMDHMMPEMNGIEATAIIRAWEKECAEKNVVPIIALTANAVVGMREMFLENGFNDFLDKPIDVGKLDEILDRWISKEKEDRKENKEENNGQVSGNSLLPIIPGVDMAKGTAMSGGTLGAYRDVLAFFRKDAQERLPLLQTAPNADALPAFVTQVHALKSASASIGAGELSAQAAALESAGKAGDIAFIQGNLGVFAKCLSELAEGILTWEKTVKEHDSEKQVTAGELDHAKITPLLHELAQALKSQKGDVIDRILEQITQQPLNSGVKTAIGQISDEVLIAEYEKALEILDNLLKGEN